MRKDRRDIMIENALRAVIIESQESDSQKLAIKYLMDNKGMSKEDANTFVRVTLRQKFPALRDRVIAKFTLGVTRMYNEEMMINEKAVDATLKLLRNYVNEYDKNLNGLTSKELVSRYAGERKNILDTEREEIESKEYGESRYTIVKINHYEEAEQYYDYTPAVSRWCLTYMDNYFDDYSCNGMNQIYFCLRDDFKSVPERVGKNAPLDDYGLSMLCVIVDEDGQLVHCTSRWNHHNGGNDNVMNAKEISEVLNTNFYQTFKPNGEWNNRLRAIHKALERGDNLYWIFDDVNEDSELYIVESYGKYNFLNPETKEFLFDKWFTWVDIEDGFIGDYCLVNKYEKYNFVTIEGRLLFDVWFDKATSFEYGYTRVCMRNKWNYINDEGQLLSDMWFDSVGGFDADGVAIVRSGAKLNYITDEGGLLSDVWFESAVPFVEGYGTVSFGDKAYNFIDADGHLLFKNNFEYLSPFTNGWAIVGRGEEYNFINRRGQYISDVWFKKVLSFNFQKIAVVNFNDKWNFINGAGEYLYDQWFDRIYSNWDGTFGGELNGETFNFERNGRLSNDYAVRESEIAKMVTEAVRKIIKK